MLHINPAGTRRSVGRSLGVLALAAGLLIATAAPAAADRHGLHSTGEIGLGDCTGFGSHVITDSYEGLAYTTRWSDATCYMLASRVRCYTIFGVIIDSGYTYASGGNPSSVGAGLGGCANFGAYAWTHHRHWANYLAYSEYIFSS